MEENTFSANISTESVGFMAMSKSYLALVDSLIAKGIDSPIAGKLANKLAENFLIYLSNNKFAEGNQIVFVPEDGLEG